MKYLGNGQRKFLRFIIYVLIWFICNSLFKVIKVVDCGYMDDLKDDKSH